MDTDEKREIIVTPEMIQAGCRILRGFNDERDDNRDIVEEIFMAMLALQGGQRSS